MGDPHACRLAPIVVGMLITSLAVPTAALAATRATNAVRSSSVVAIAAADDNIPGYDTDSEFGLNVAQSVYTGSIDATTNADDVYAIWLTAGEQLDMWLDRPNGSDVGLYLFDPDAVDITTDPYRPESMPTVADGGLGNDPMSSAFTATESGYYYVDVYAYSGGGSYTLRLTVQNHEAQINLSTSSYTLGLWSAPTIKGRVDDVRSTWDPVGFLTLSCSFDGQEWYPVSRQLYGGGEFTFLGLNQWRKTYYMITFHGDPGGASSWVPVATQGTGAYATRVRITTPIAPSRMYRNKPKTIYGYIEPGHTAGSSPVRIYKYKKVSGRWKSYGYSRARAYTVSGSKSKYAIPVTFTSAGSWRVRAYAPADSQHAATTSGYDYITVK